MRPLQLSREKKYQNSEVGKMGITVRQAFEPSHTESLHGASGLTQGLSNPRTTDISLPTGLGSKQPWSATPSVEPAVMFMSP